jgi:hypothetical protein
MALLVERHQMFMDFQGPSMGHGGVLMEKLGALMEH